MKSKNTKKNSATKFGCDFCGRSFQKETTIDKHLCENKRRWGDKDLKGNRIGFQSWLNFYVHNTTSKKQKTYLDFIKSAYYLDTGSPVMVYINWKSKNQKNQNLLRSPTQLPIHGQ